MTIKKQRVCYFGTYRANYPRNRILIDGLRKKGIDVIECHAQLWHGLQDREDIANGGWKSPKFWIRIITTYSRLLWKFVHVGHFDVMVVGYPGQLDIFFGGMLCLILRKPLIWDVFMSVYLISSERQFDKQNPRTKYFIKFLEGVSLRVPNLLLFITKEYSDWFVNIYKIQSNKIRLLPLCADERRFKPIYTNKQKESTFRCIFFGSFIPTHGVEYILEAAKILQNDKDIIFELIGAGPELDKLVSFARKQELTNVSFLNWIPNGKLIEKISDADVCLGTFEDTPHAMMTIQNKILESLSMAKPIITGDSPIIRRIFKNKEHMYLCKRKDPVSLALAIQKLKSDPQFCRKISKQGYDYYKKHFSSKQVTYQFITYITEILDEGVV